MEVNEKNWKLFRESLPKWQERYMEKLVEEYIEILKKDEAHLISTGLSKVALRQIRETPELS